MRLSINQDTIRTAIKPYQFSVVDILSILPRLSIGSFEGCVLNLACNKVLIITEGMVLAYLKLEDFIQGLEPLSLVKDDSIHYSQEGQEISFNILKDEDAEVDDTEFSKVRELMFGARNNEDAATNN